MPITINNIKDARDWALEHSIWSNDEYISPSERGVSLPTDPDRRMLPTDEYPYYVLGLPEDSGDYTFTGE